MLSVSQDIIVKKDASTILAKVLEVNQNEIKYKNIIVFSNAASLVTCWADTGNTLMQSITTKQNEEISFSYPPRLFISSHTEISYAYKSAWLLTMHLYCYQFKSLFQ